MFKDELCGNVGKEIVALCPKMYSCNSQERVVKEDGTVEYVDSIKKVLKGVPASTQILKRHTDYYNCLFPGSSEEAVQSSTFTTIRQKEHYLYTYNITKKSLCAYDSKRYHLFNTECRAFGHYLNGL